MTSRFRPLYVLMHGWGFDAALWDGVRGRLPGREVLTLDYGYFGERRMPDALPTDRPLIAVGHSFGGMLLLQRSDVPWAGFVAVNGFARFAFAEDYPHGVRRRLIEQMVKRFDENPAPVLADFRARCGASEPVPDNLRVGCLRSGLCALRDGDARAAAAALPCPALLLAGDADPIVPPEMTRDSAVCFRYARTEWLAGGGHLLPRLAPDWCVGHLTAFASKLTGETG